MKNSLSLLLWCNVCVQVCVCVCLLSPILDSSASMILLTDSCISTTYRGAKGERGGGDGGGGGWMK